MGKPLNEEQPARRRERARLYAKSIREADPVAAAAKLKRYKTANKEKIKANKADYRARLQAANPGGTYTGKVCARHPELEGLRDTAGQACLACKSERRKRHRSEHRELEVAQTKDWFTMKKVKAFASYGSECQVCGETDYDVLAIDHIDGGGNAHRKAINTQNIYHWLEKNDYPAGFRCLCFNCNQKSAVLMRRTGKPLMGKSSSMPIGALQKEIKAWADSVYPTRTVDSIILKLGKELQELMDATDDPLEYADLVILILDLASLKQISVQHAVRDKLAINNARRWTIDPNTGEMSHVKI